MSSFRTSPFVGTFSGMRISAQRVCTAGKRKENPNTFLQYLFQSRCFLNSHVWTSTCISDQRLVRYTMMLNVAVYKNEVCECNQTNNLVSLNISFAI